jgi:hypothetical protein
MKVVSVALLYGFLLLVWFRTNAIVEYINLFKLDKLPKIKEYNELHSNGYEGNFSDFLYEYYKDMFLVRLVTCPICLSFWLGLFTYLFSQNVESLLVAPLALFSYTVLNKML